MHPIFIVLIVLGSLLLLAALLWLFMICPAKKGKEIDKFTSIKYAHRGLYNSERAENSLSAFAAAKAAGFGIELDVRLSKDGELVVFHDDNLTRVVGKEGKVIDFTAEELSKMSLSGTSDGVPTFRQVLDLIDGAVPLLVEIKMEIGESGIAEKFVEVVDGYKGDLIVESFNPLALMVVKKKRPELMRGLLTRDYAKVEKCNGIIYLLLKSLLVNFLIRTHFIALEKESYSLKNVRFIRRSFGTPVIAWTIKSPEEDALAISRGFDTVIFEGYIPENKV